MRLAHADDNARVFLASNRTVDFRCRLSTGD